jgi:hypothetical protein
MVDIKAMAAFALGLRYGNLTQVLLRKTVNRREELAYSWPVF